MKILQVNDVDIYGRSFNGYDIAARFNERKIHSVKQLVITKFSKNENVSSIYKDKVGIEFEEKLYELEKKYLSVHSLLSATSYFVRNNADYKEADTVHYHQVHNMHLNLTEFAEAAKRKPTVMSFHDPWPLTGRCVHPGKCEKWKNGCRDCEHLDTLFDFSVDNCGKLWKIKSQIFKDADPDVVVHSGFMYDLVKSNPYTKDLNVHLVNLGLDLKKFEFTQTKSEARKKLKIPQNSIVLFFRGQKALKGTEYIVEALKGLETRQRIVLLTCSQSGLLKEIEDKYKVIELGNIDQKTVLTCFNACDVFLMPSLGESFGMMAIEAMAAGKPVVVFNNTAMPTVTFAPECGVLVNDRDSNDLREKIKYLIESPEERTRRGELGKKLAFEHYDIEKYYSQMEEVYRKAYERQRYKLETGEVSVSDYDREDIEVKKLVLKLKKVAEELFPLDNNFDTLNGIDYTVNETDDIDYCNINVQRAILAFNEEVSRKIEALDNEFFAMSNRGFRKYKIYKAIKQSAFLKKVFYKVKHLLRNRSYERYNGVMLELKKMQLENKILERKIDLLLERMDGKNDK